MLIQEATLDDCRAIAQLHATSWHSVYRGAFSESYLSGDVFADRSQLWKARLTAPPGNQHILLARDETDILGFACLFRDENPAWGSFLNNLHVSPGMRRSGIGRSLLHAAALTCLEHGGDGGLYLWVLQSNHEAQDFYRHFGARNVEEDVWIAFGGTEAPIFRFFWPNLKTLAVASTPSSIKSA